MKKEDLKDYLKRCDFSDNYIDEVIQYVDDEKDIESLVEKIKFLKKYDVTNEGIELIISENPLFLSTSLDNLKKSVNFLINIKIDNLASVLEINSELLSVSDQQMSENYKLLKILIPERELLNMLKIDAEILSFNTDYLEKRLEFLIKNGFKDNIKNIVLNYFDAFEEDEEDLDIEEIKKYI